MITRFLIMCSGANRDILRDCPTEKTKFIGIGATILATAVLASISGGYALYFTFQDYFVAIPFGILWGLVIFNLDRYIVTSIKKTGNLKKEFLMALPRVLIALVLAVTISKPLEIKLFGGTIAKRMGETENLYNNSCAEKIQNQRKGMETTIVNIQNNLVAQKKAVYANDPVYQGLNSQQAAKNTRQQNIRTQIADNRAYYNEHYYVERYFNTATNSMRQRTLHTQEAIRRLSENTPLQNESVSLSQELAQINSDIQKRENELRSQVTDLEQKAQAQKDGIQSQIQQLDKNTPAELAKCAAEAAGDKDILSRLRALGDLTTFGNTVWWASLMITLLFMLLETAPIMVKLMASRGPYDDIIDRVETEISLEQKKILDNIHADSAFRGEEARIINKLKGEIRLKTEQAKIDAELKANEALLKDISDKVASLAALSVDKWYEDELSKLNGQTPQP